MTELEFHKERIDLCTAIIEGALAHNRILDLYMEMNPVAHIAMMDTLLQSAKRNDEFINCFSQLYRESEQFLIARDIDPYPPMTAEEKKEFDKLYPDPYRWRWPAWIRIPITNFFQSLKKKRKEIPQSLFIRPASWYQLHTNNRRSKKQT